MAKRRIEPLVTGRIRLRLLEEADLPLTREWRNQDHIRKWFLRTDVITEEQHAAWYAEYKDRDDDFVFVIEEMVTLGRAVGQVALYRIDWTRGTAEFGRLLIGDAEASGQGLATVATECLVRVALTVWGLRQVVLEVREDNTPAIAVYATCGFIQTGKRDGVIEMSTSNAPRVGGLQAC